MYNGYIIIIILTYGRFFITLTSTASSHTTYYISVVTICKPALEESKKVLVIFGISKYHQGKIKTIYQEDDRSRQRWRTFSDEIVPKKFVSSVGIFFHLLML